MLRPVEAYGRLDILVNNAGTTRFIPLHDLRAADYAVAPGLIDTSWYDGAEQVGESSREWITANTPLHRVGSPADVAEAVHYLANAAYTTGDVLTVGGGRHTV
ncbi:hypothetical protein ABB07_00795 [Streptomyces incarnatus]|uniref:Short-chain dehydrogenase n=1 Tax=Streptomyces incarnatus TaxID=665007 RepID=A0ABM5TCF1_9ACTN|nr:SDR family oxidoreductase [Streptomyces incarnatus]AKJ08629.1 hypothetical protein ABB07_00795 [Streptomyces incarnatus]